MKKRTIEKELVAAVRQAGGIAPKFISPDTLGMPDRLVLFPGGKIGFVEVEGPRGVPVKRRVRRHCMLNKLGFQTFLVNDVLQIPGTIEDIKEGADG